MVNFSWCIVARQGFAHVGGVSKHKGQKGGFMGGGQAREA